MQGTHTCLVSGNLLHVEWWSNKIKNTVSLNGFSESRLRRLPENQARERYTQAAQFRHES